MAVDDWFVDTLQSALEPDEDGSYAIDFNLAYHPSCVYAPQFSCPLTPAENRLPIRIEAGERLAEDTAH